MKNKCWLIVDLLERTVIPASSHVASSSIITSPHEATCDNASGSKRESDSISLETLISQLPKKVYGDLHNHFPCSEQACKEALGHNNV